MAAAKEHGLSMMYVPKVIKVVDAIPLFPTGKPDYIKCMEVYKNS